MPSPATLRRAGRLRDGETAGRGARPGPSAHVPHRAAPPLLTPACPYGAAGPLRGAADSTRSPRPRLAPRGTFVPDENESAPGRGRPRPAAEVRAGAPRDFLQVHVLPGPAGGAGRNLQSPAVGRAEGCGRARGGPAARPGHNGRRRAGAGTARARLPRGRSSGAARAPNAAAAAWHRRAARPVHANGRRPRHELFSSGAERASAARRAARPARPPPLRSRRGDFPNFPRSAPRMRPPRRLRPRPSAPAALPTLPPILCLLSRSWHLSQRARFPAHPFAAGSGRGRGYGGPGEEETGRWGWGKQGAYGPRSQERPPEDRGRARGSGRLCSAGRSRLRLCPEYQRSLGGPPAVPAAGEDGPRPLPDSHHPPPPRTLLRGPARAGGAGGSSSGFAARTPRLAPQARVRAPAGTPPPALPAARPRPAAPPACRRGQGAPRREDPHRPPASRPGAARLRGRAGASPGPCSPGRPGTEAAAGARSAAAFRGAGCHDCGQEGRARRLWPRSGTRGGPTVSGLRADPGAPRTAARVAGSALQGPACAPELWTKSRARARGRRRRRPSPRAGCVPGDPAAALLTAPVRRREGRGARCGGGRGARDLVKWRGAAHRAQRWRGCARCLAEEGCPQGAGKAWDGGGTVPRAAAQLGARSSFPAETTSCSASLGRRSCGGF